MVQENVSERRWLVLEDDAALRTGLVDLLAMWGISAMVFEAGQAAMIWLDEVEAGRVDRLPELALLDMRLPLGGPQGHEVAGRMQSLAVTKDVTMVMMTAYRFSPQERAHIEQMAPPDLFISKPLPDPIQFREMLDSALTA